MNDLQLATHNTTTITAEPKRTIELKIKRLERELLCSWLRRSVSRLESDGRSHCTYSTYKEVAALHGDIQQLICGNCVLHEDIVLFRKKVTETVRVSIL